MKKLIYTTLALGAVLLAASCQKENTVNTPPVFTAYVDSDTKTVLNGEVSEWNQDHIWILNGDPDNTGWKKEYKTDATSGTSAVFTEVVSSELGSGPVVAICPASAGNDAWWNSECPDVANKLKLEPSQNAIAGTYDPNAHIAVAYSENTSLSFKNAVSLFKFKVVSDNVTEVCIYSNTNTDVLAGHFSVAVTDPDTIYKDASEGVEQFNYVKAKGSFKKGETYYIACLPTTFTDGFTVEVVSNGVKGKDKTTNKEYTLKRNTILDLGDVEYVEKPVETKTLYLDADVWNTSDARFAVYSFGNGEEWTDMTLVSGSVYKVDVKTSYPNLIFVRMNGETSENNWDNDWNKTNDLTLPSDNKNLYTITGWGNYGENSPGSWSLYSK